MSLEEDDSHWKSNPKKCFNFDEDDQATSQNAVQSNSGYTPTGQSGLNSSSDVKTLGSILAATPSSNEPFLRPSMIMCPDNRVEELIKHLDSLDPDIQLSNLTQDPKTYIRDIVDRKCPINFSPYKSKREKLLLLDCAICCSDGDTITAATIFISETLKQSIFDHEIKKRPIAVDHYINYLKMTGKSREVADFTKRLSSKS